MNPSLVNRLFTGSHIHGRRISFTQRIWENGTLFFLEKSDQSCCEVVTS